jgi:RNA polymerase sigma factor (TIGR02999 family)
MACLWNQTVRICHASMSDATVLLQAAENGDSKAAEELLNLVYDELRRLAAARMAHLAPGQTLQPTALVHEAWVRLVKSNHPTYRNSAHFFSAAAEAMRHILIDRARRKQAERHGGRFERTEFDELQLASPASDDVILAVHEALEIFHEKYPVQAELVKLRYFAGMTSEEISQVTGISLSKVNNYWTFSRAWLFRHIRET